jgi:pyruvate,water dikinase
MSETVLWLGDPACQSASVVGNKGAALARLLQRGHEVPDGFVLSTDGLLSESWRDEVEGALGRLARPWAVRSSSTAEDGANVAFAGLFTTVLGLTDPGAVLAAVEAVAAGLDDAAVLAYAKRRAVGADGIRMGVLVQTLVAASVAGVAFSRDPVTGAEEIVIEANYGLGETVVDGSVVPDGARVARDGTIAERRLGGKAEKVVFDGDGLRRVPTSSAERESFALSESAIEGVAALVRRLESDAGRPVDVEWAIAGENLYLLQSRAITT